MLKESIEYKRFVWDFRNSIDIINVQNNIVFLCIGTSAIVGDSFGPCVGSNLKNLLKDNKRVKILGDLINDITYNKIEKVLTDIQNQYKNSLVIVIDSALATNENIGKVFVQNRGLRYAESLGRPNAIIGNVSIKAVVGKNSNNSIINFKNLRDVSMERINVMSNLVARGIFEVITNKKENNGKNIYI